MIRSCRIPLDLLKRWLVRQEQSKYSGQYRLRVWREDEAERESVLDELIDYVQEALDDARSKIRSGFSDSLSPFKNAASDPAANYPAALHRNTLKGYLGETLAGLAVEHFGAFGEEEWHIPAYLFRMHNTEFQHLDQINEDLQSGKVLDPDSYSEIRPGRTGDDVIAFRIGDTGKITHVLTLEAKCLARSNSDKIIDAHAKLSADRPRRSSGVREVINILSDYDTPEADKWQARLLSFWMKDSRNAEQLDGLAYAVGHHPIRDPERISWLPVDAPHEAYTGKRRLEAMEFQFTDLEELVELLYRDESDG